MPRRQLLNLKQVTLEVRPRTPLARPLIVNLEACSQLAL